MSKYFCCCFHKKVKNKQIKALNPQNSHIVISPNDYVMENLCIVKVQQSNGTDKYYGKTLNKMCNTGNSVSSSDILVRQQPCIVSKRQIKSYPSSPKQEDNDLTYFSDPVLEYGHRNRQLLDTKNDQQVYITKVNNSKHDFYKQKEDKRKYKNSVRYERNHEEPFPFKMPIGERKFTSLLYDYSPEEVLKEVQRKIQERRFSQMTESPETSLYCNFETDNSDFQYTSQEDVVKSHWKSERNSPYYVHSSETSDDENIKMQRETISDQKRNQEMCFGKQWGKNEKPFATQHHKINNKLFPEKQEKFPSTTSLTNQEPDKISITSQEPVKMPASTAENNEAPFKLPLVYSATMPQPRCKSILSSSIEALTNQNSQTISSKPIRHSRDIDVFVVEKQKQALDEPEPQYINVGRGPRIRGTTNELLVTDYLNKFSSMFVDNLKEPIPKDPLTKPRAYNVYVPPKPRTQSRGAPLRNIQRQPLTPPPKRISIVSKPRKGLQYIPKREQDGTSTDEDVRDPRNNVMFRRSITRPRKNMSIHSAQVKDKNPYRKADEYQKLKTNDVDGMNLASDEGESDDETLHGLRCVGPNKETNSNSYNNATSTLNTSQETINNDVEDGETDLICYPTNKFLSETLLEASSSGSNKLRWKIIIKRGNEKP